MSLTSLVAGKLKSQPKIKRFVKNTYRTVGNLLSDKRTEPESIVCESDQAYENLFGYYDKSPWNIDGSKMLYLRAKGCNASKIADSQEEAEIILKEKQEEKTIARTHAWNVQQGCMLQWLGPDFDSRILYNDFREGKLVAVIQTVATGEEKVLPLPVYSVSADGAAALSLDFTRLHTLRPGYGYCNLPDQTKNSKIPDGPCIYRVDIAAGKTIPIMDYDTLLKLRPLDTMKDAYHKINHIMIHPDGSRFIFMHRWILNGVKYDRLLSCDLQGKDIRILLDDGMVSHCNFKNNRQIIAFANTKEHGSRYYLVEDAAMPSVAVIENMPDFDGHPSYSPDGKYIVCDSYPNFKCKQRIYLYCVETKEIRQIASVYMNKKYKNETRCDLHPRWKRDSTAICFDGAQKKYRQVYTLKIR